VRSEGATDAYAITHIGADVKLIKAQVCSTTICYYSYDFEGAFSLNAANTVRGAIFRPEKSKIYFIGSLVQILSETFPYKVGYVMEVDYLSTAP
jgi:hypothetical protein